MPVRSSRNRRTWWSNAARCTGRTANNGIWNWDNEIVVGFTLGYMSTGFDGHPIDSEKGSQAMFARSLDGGATWTFEPLTCADGSGERYLAYTLWDPGAVAE